MSRGGSPRPIKDYITEDPSGINWIKIGDTTKNGKYIESAKEKIRPEGVKKSRMVHIGDFLLTNSMSFGRPYILKIDGCIHDGWLVISPHKGSYNSDFLYYLLSSAFAFKQFAEVASGGVVTNLNSDKVADSMFPLPPLGEQHRIVVAVEKWFSLIDMLESEKEDLQTSITQAKSKILNLAIHGNLVPQDPQDEPAIELLKRINPSFKPCDNAHYPNTIPNSWTWTRLESISSDSADGPFGSNLKKEHYTTRKEVRIIQLSNIGEEGWREDNTKYTTFEHLKEISRSEVFPNDIVIAKMMPAGRAILCPQKEHEYVLSSDAVKFHILDGVYNKYILYAINSKIFKSQVYDNVQGVTRVRTSLQKLRSYYVPIPPYQEQLRIVKKIEELYSVLDEITKAIAS